MITIYTTYNCATSPHLKPLKFLSDDNINNINNNTPVKYSYFITETCVGTQNAVSKCSLSTTDQSHTTTQCSERHASARNYCEEFVCALQNFAGRSLCFLGTVHVRRGAVFCQCLEVPAVQPSTIITVNLNVLERHRCIFMTRCVSSDSLRVKGRSWLQCLCVLVLFVKSVID